MEDFTEQNWHWQYIYVFLRRLQFETCKPAAIVILLRSIIFGCSEASQLLNKIGSCSAQAHHVLIYLSIWHRKLTEILLSPCK